LILAVSGLHATHVFIKAVIISVAMLKQVRNYYKNDTKTTSNLKLSMELLGLVLLPIVIIHPIISYSVRVHGKFKLRIIENNIADRF